MSGNWPRNSTQQLQAEDQFGSCIIAVSKARIYIPGQVCPVSHLLQPISSVESARPNLYPGSGSSGLNLCATMPQVVNRKCQIYT
eukprot:11092006-Karenia_brevis.AAC.1